MEEGVQDFLLNDSGLGSRRRLIFVNFATYRRTDLGLGKTPGFMTVTN